VPDAEHHGASPSLVLTADWVLPVSRPAIRGGGVLVRDGLVAAVGTREHVEALAPLGSERRVFDGATLTPGLVNAHTHLALTDLAGRVPPMPFVEWLPRLVAEMKPWQIADFATSAENGARQSLDAGVTAVGDIVYGPAEAEMAAAEGLGGVFYTEILGVPAENLDDALATARFPADATAAAVQRRTLGLSPHSPYTSGPALLQAVYARAGALNLPFAVHLAESAAEVELLADGTGALAATASRTADGFFATGTSPVVYLAVLGVLAGATLVHLGEASPGDIAVMAAMGVRGAVTCPRSNRYLGNRVADVPTLLSAGIPVGIGTDSSASNEDLDLLAEVRALSREYPQLEPVTLIEIATALGASALGLGGRLGVLEPGAAADIAVWGFAPEREPERAIVERGGADTLAALLVDGGWRR
jgi:cytosine/adenosine deaminase-related metal-dependent hydrolase